MAAHPRTDGSISDRDLPFAHFGILDSGRQSKGSLLTAIVLNVAIVALLLIVGATVKTRIRESQPQTLLVAPVLIQDVPRRLPPKPVLRPSPPAADAPPRIPSPARSTSPLSPPQAPVLRMAPVVPVVVPPIAPQVTPLPITTAAIAITSLPAKAAPISLGQSTNQASTTSATARAINLGGPTGGSTTSSGANHLSAINLRGSGSTNNAGSSSGRVEQVALGHKAPISTTANTGPAPVSLTSSGPKVLYKPTPVYTQEAADLHIAGAVAIKIRVSATGSVTVLGITSPLGHGLDQSAETAIQHTRFSPALDLSGRPVEWEGIVHVTFQLAG